MNTQCSNIHLFLYYFLNKHVVTGLLLLLVLSNCSIFHMMLKDRKQSFIRLLFKYCGFLTKNRYKKLNKYCNIDLFSSFDKYTDCSSVSTIECIAADKEVSVSSCRAAFSIQMLNHEINNDKQYHNV